MWKFLKQCFYAGRVIVKRFIDDRLTYAASALTYTTLLALVPLMAVSFGILSAFPVFHSLSGEIQQFIFQNFIPASGKIIQQYLNQFSMQAGKLSLVSTIFLIVTAVMMMLTIESALNDIWKIYQRRQGLSAILRYWAVLSLAPIFVGISIAATSYIISLPLIAGTASSLGIKTYLISSVPIVFTIIAFMLLYVVVPNCHVPIRYAFLGSLIATLLFELTKRGFVIYIQHFATYELIYGAVAAVPIFLVWLYLLWVIILFGALISNIFSTHYFADTADEIDGFTHAFLWLGHLWKAQREGRTLSVRQLHRCVPGNYKIAGSNLIFWLQKLHLIERTFSHRYLLARDFSQMTLSDLYHCLPWKLPEFKDHQLISPEIEKVFQRANNSLTENLDVSLSELYEDLFKT